jgi:ubiquinone/menaquinone biosynthesis C-methylase UbiE
VGLFERRQIVSAADKVFTGSMAEIYDTHLVPLIFECYAADLASRAAAMAPDAALEIAAGSGVLTRALGDTLRPDTRQVATDLNAPMLDQAASVQADPGRVEWRTADAMDLPFAAESFDMVACQFGVMFFPDRVKAYAEARRVLQPGGSFIYNMWDRIEENDFAHVVTCALADCFPTDPPRFLARTPHGHHDPSQFEAELREAGFNDVTVEAVDDVSVASGPEIPAIAYCRGTPLRSEIEDREGPDLEQATAYAAAAIADRFGTGRVEGRVRGFVITAS